MEQNRTIGIVGGMGPQAGNALFESITRQTAAACDQQHLPVILMSFPELIADRTAFLEGRGVENPAFNIARIIARLECGGASIVGMACNTAYVSAIYEVILSELDRNQVRVELLHMPLEACRYIGETLGDSCRVGLMATNGTYRSGVYREAAYTQGFELLLPDPVFQQEVIHRMIYDPRFGIKANACEIHREVHVMLERTFEYFAGKGVDALIVGCTELSIAARARIFGGIKIIDPVEVFARALIREACAGRPERLHLEDVDTTI